MLAGEPPAISDDITLLTFRPPRRTRRCLQSSWGLAAESAADTGGAEVDEAEGSVPQTAGRVWCAACLLLARKVSAAFPPQSHKDENVRQLQTDMNAFWAAQGTTSAAAGGPVQIAWRAYRKAGAMIRLP